MKLQLSRFGTKLSAHSGILELMDDLGKALGGSERLIMMGGGNPAHIPHVEEFWRRRIAAILEHTDKYDKMLGDYDEPQGRSEFTRALAECLNQRYGWGLTPANIAVTNGSQTAFFLLLNMLAGDFEDGSRRKILMPLMPEYIGYADQGMAEDLFTSIRPKIQEIGEHEFKYHIDFNNLVVGDDVGALCVSRPTNPTGNVLTDKEVDHLVRLAKSKDIPLIIDNAYGAPFPDVIFTDAQPVWNEHIILTFSLSKLGLPGTRTGIVVAHEDVIRALAAVNAVVSLSNVSVGQALVTPMIESGELLKLSTEIIKPFYEKKSERAQAWIHESFPDGLEYRVHKSEGAFFLWLWFPELPVSADAFYQRLKKRGVIVVPGHYFFYGLAEPWNHAHQCIRLTFAQPDEIVKEGIGIIAEELEKLERI